MIWYFYNFCVADFTGLRIMRKLFSSKIPNMLSKIKSFFSELTLLSSMDLITKALLVFLPFNVVVSVFVQYKLGIPAISYLKEAIVLSLGMLLVFWFYREKKLPKLDFIDYSILAYIAILILITIFN